MINTSMYTQAQVADNEVVINGVSFGKLADKDAERLITIIRGMQSGTPVQASTPAKAPAKASKKPVELAPAEDVVLDITPVTAPKGQVAFTLGWGNGRGGAKLMVKDAGFAWSEALAGEGHKGAWVGTTAQAKKLGITAKSTKLTVSATWVQAGRDKAAEKAAKRA